MLITREELQYDFRGAKFDLASAKDRAFLGWIFNQFLYGEVTGIQCGHWLYRAPHLNAASFLAKQASEELSHVRKILRILNLLGESPAPAHRMIRFMATGMMGGSWGEHVALEMALGEGLVLAIFYAMAETISDPEIRKILESAASEEERHVEFGERETEAWLKAHPSSRPMLLGSALVQLWAMRALRKYVTRWASRGPDGSVMSMEHPVLSHMSAFYDHTIRNFELRIERLGLSEVPLRELRLATKARLLGSVIVAKTFGKAAGWIRGRLGFRDGLLTETYLDDPVVSAERARDRAAF